LQDVRNQTILPVPVHLRDRHYEGAQQLGHGDHYQYPHDAVDGWCEQDYLGVPKTYYQPTDRGHEAEFRQRLQELRRRREQSEQND